MQSKNIVLIGFMGVGKGTIARALVEKTGMYAVDTDDMIESLENRKIRKIFKEDGEPYFRNLEKRTADWLEKNVHHCIISTGGGFYKVENLNKIGTVVYLQSSFEAIVEKIFNHPKAKKKIKKRPLLKNQDEARALFEQRKSEYSTKADIALPIEDKETEELVAELLQMLS
jgi:shikimate kinase